MSLSYLLQYQFVHKSCDDKPSKSYEAAYGIYPKRLLTDRGKMILNVNPSQGQSHSRTEK